jgi:hypothetical protein
MEIINNPTLLNYMSLQAGKLQRLNANELIIKEILDVQNIST